MCPSAKPCSKCAYPYINYAVTSVDEDETIRLCQSCFMSRCFQMVLQQKYPEGATMDEFRQQVLAAKIPTL